MLKIKYSYVSSQVLRHQNQRRYKTELKHALLNGKQEGFQVEANLNRAHKQNYLSTNFMEEIVRFLDSYDIDDAIHYVWLRSDKQIFSRGTDLQYILKSEATKAQEYLSDVQRLAIYFGTYNKALLPIVEGEIQGSMASMISTLPFALNTNTAKYRWNEVHYGFVPHGGASYILSRMPHELGTYLALTGRWVSGRDALRLNLAFASMEDFEEAKNSIAELKAVTPRTAEIYGNQFNQMAELFETGMETFQQNLTEEFKTRIVTEDPKLVITELLYKYKKFEEANIYRGNEFQQQIANPMLTLKEEVFGTLIDCGYLKKPIDQSYNLDVAMIARCFSTNTIADIKERLRAEKSEFAKGLLTDMESRSPVALGLTLKLLRNAESLQWRECLSQEHRVTCNLAVHEEFKKGMLRVQKEKVQFADIENLDSFFEEVSKPLETLKHALQPVKEFYEEYSDNVRFFLNEQSLRRDLSTRADQEIDVMQFMRNHKLPMDGSISVQEIRKMQSDIHEQKRDLSVQFNKLKSIIEFPENLKNYYNKRMDAVLSTDLSTLIEEGVQNVFEKSYQDRLDSYRHVAKIANSADQVKLFSAVRNLLLNTKLTQKDIVEPQKWGSQMQRLLVFPKNDKDSFVDSRNTEPIVDRHLDLNEQKNDQMKLIKQGADYRIRYGDPLLQFQPQFEKYYNRLRENTKNFENIEKYLNGKEDEEIVRLLKGSVDDTLIQLQSCAVPKDGQILEALEQELKMHRISRLLKESQPDNQLFSVLSEEQQELLTPVNDDVEPFLLPVQKQVQSLLNTMYQSRAKKMVPFLNLGGIDQAINKSLQKDSFELIESNLFFSFSYVVLLYLERANTLLTSINDLSFDAQAAAVKTDLNVNLQSREQFMELLEYLDDLLEMSTILYDKYREKLVNTSDKLLYSYIRLNRASDDFTSTAITRRQLYEELKQEEAKHLKVLNEGVVEYPGSVDEVYTALEKPIEDLDDDRLDEEEELPDEFDISWKGDYEQSLFYKLNKIIRHKNKDQKSLIVGIDYYLSQMDLIAARQMESTPKHLLDKNAELQSIAQGKCFKDQPINEWMKQFVNEVINELFRLRKDVSFDCKLAEMLEPDNFRKALVMVLREDQQHLEQLHQQLLVSQSKIRNQDIQDRKFNQTKEQTHDQALSITIREVDRLMGYQNYISPEAVDYAESAKHPLFKEQTKQGQVPSQYVFNRLKKSLSHQVESVITDLSKQTQQSYGYPNEINLLYERIAQKQQNLKQ